jgi:hypothetical protein
MDVLKMLAELRSERERVEEAILAVERLAIAGRGRRRGRPPKWMSVEKGASDGPGEPKKKRAVSLAARKRMAKAQKKRWAAKKKQPEAA